MDVGGTFDRGATPPSDECLQQLQRILQSVTFRNATTIQELLQFLATRALEGSAEPLKEYTIGVEAFGRPQDFDPKTDTIVRVQIHRLRQKLKEYYDGDGTHDPILVEIPKGHYVPTFEIVPALDHEEDRTLEHRVRVNTRAYWIAFCIVIAVLGIFASGFYIGVKRQSGRMVNTGRPSARDYLSRDEPVKAFWASFIGDDPSPVIAYPDAVFLLDDTNDLFRFRQGASDNRGALVDPHLARRLASNPRLVSEAGDLYYENGYTGAGELQGIAMLCGLFGEMGVRPILKPSRDITPADLREHNVIMLGSSFQNVAVADLITGGDFSFRNPDSHLEQWRAVIVNHHPLQGEDGTYHTERDLATHALKADYGIISVQDGVVPGRHVAMLGGLDTTGTEGAILIATSRSGIEELQKALGSEVVQDQALKIPRFQALVRIQLEKGYQVLGASVVTVHKVARTDGPASDHVPAPVDASNRSVR